MSIDYSQIPSPCFVLDESLLKRNLQILNDVRERAGVQIILALKGYAMWSTFPLVRQYLDGTTASSLHEARLIHDEMSGKAHTYAPVYFSSDMDELLSYSSHISFNSLSQWERYKEQVLNYKERVSPGLRINPGYSDVQTALYNPCSPGSRLGITSDKFTDGLPEGIEGLHFHSLCESDSFALERTLESVEKNFGNLLKQVQWLNMGGGHLITRKDYDREHLVKLLQNFKAKYPNLQIILEPGAAIGWQTGYLVSTVLDIVENKGITTAMLDVSFTAHMPDTLEMPYKPRILCATDPVEGRPTYRMGGTTCLSGDFMGDYSFEQPLKVGDLVIFDDMIHYTMVKTSTFNGVPHPSIGIWKENDSFELVREFGYEDYKNRLS